MSIITHKEPSCDYNVTTRTFMANKLLMKHVVIGISMKQTTSLVIQVAKDVTILSCYLAIQHEQNQGRHVRPRSIRC